MKNLGVKLVFVIILTFIFSVLWLSFSDFIPKPPEAFSLWFVHFFNAKTAEDVADIEVFFVFSISFIFSLVSVFIFSIFKSFKTKPSHFVMMFQQRYLIYWKPRASFYLFGLMGSYGIAGMC